MQQELLMKGEGILTSLPTRAFPALDFFCFLMSGSKNSFPQAVYTICKKFLCLKLII